MKYYLGVDTSNYTTSVALCGENGVVYSNSKKLLSVKQGERGLRQSDVLFAHTVNLPEVVKGVGAAEILAIGYSAYPRDVEGSYMPCFLCGKAFAESMATIMGVPAVPFSHQRGHIRAALYSAGAEHLLGKEYIAFHLSGGTTEILHCKSDEINLVGGTKDLTAGQVIDRVGVMLGLSFPCGVQLERLAMAGERPQKCKLCVTDLECNLSGLENMARKLYESGATKEDTAAFTLEFVLQTLDKLTENVTQAHPNLPLVYSGGVMSNKRIKEYFKEKYNAYFAAPEYSSDNAAGTSLLTYDFFG